VTFETYWLVAPLALLGLSGFGWLALWITRHPKQTAPQVQRSR
jgi:hypothetical protein